MATSWVEQHGAATKQTELKAQTVRGRLDDAEILLHEEPHALSAELLVGRRILRKGERPDRAARGPSSSNHDGTDRNAQHATMGEHMVAGPFALKTGCAHGHSPINNPTTAPRPE